jgi:hypothetical protein
MSVIYSVILETSLTHCSLPVYEHLEFVVHAVSAFTIIEYDGAEIVGSIQSRLVYDNTMQPYNVSRILSPQLTLDMQAYESYSPLFMSYVYTLFSPHFFLTRDIVGRALLCLMGAVHSDFTLPY